MKKIFVMGFSVMALAGAAFAADDGSAIESANTFGLMEVNSTASRTIVAIPWCDSSTTNDRPIYVKDVVKTANLTINDTLHLIDNENNIANWQLKAKNGTNYWATVPSVNGFNSVAESTPESEATVSRGSALILLRQHPTYTAEDYATDSSKTVGAAVPFYLYGQVAATSTNSVIKAGESATKPCYNWVAAPSTVAQAINGDSTNGATWETDKINANDRIVIPTANLSVELFYDSTIGGWCYTATTTKPGKGEVTIVVNTTVKYEGTIPVGTGFWYISAGGSPTITWTDVPTK